MQSGNKAFYFETQTIPSVFYYTQILSTHKSSMIIKCDAK